MSVGERMVASLPERLNKNDEILEALFCNDTGTSAFEKMFNYGQDILNEFANTSNFYDFTDTELDFVTNIFCAFPRNYAEEDSALKSRVKAVFNRLGDTTWGTLWNIKHVFEQYFIGANVFILENCAEFDKSDLNVNSNVNLIKNPFFKDDLDYWTGTGELSKTEAFCGLESCKLACNQSIKQTVNLPNTSEFANEQYYFIHFVSIGKTTLKVKKNNEYTNLWFVGDDVDSVNITSITTRNEYKQDDWKQTTAFFKACGNDDIEIEFSNTENDGSIAYVDLIQLYKKQPFAQFCVIARFPSESYTENTLHLAQGSVDNPITEEETEIYKAESYHEHSFVSGASAGTANDIFGEILTLVKPCGIRAFAKVVIKENSKEGD